MRGKWVSWSVALLFLGFTLADGSADQEEPIQTQADRNAIAAQDYQAADAELNQSYEALISLLEGEERQMLIKAETAWIKYRDAEAEFEAYGWTGGTAYPLIYMSSLTSLTQSRIDEIKLILEDIKSQRE